MEMVQTQLVAKVFLLLPFFFSLHVLLLEAGMTELIFCQKLQFQLLYCLCKHCLVLVCLKGEAQHCQSEQDESVFQTFKDATEKQNCGRNSNNQIHGACCNGQVLQGNSDALKFVLIQRQLRFSFEVNKRISNGSKHLITKASISFPFSFSPKLRAGKLAKACSLTPK